MELAVMHFSVLAITPRRPDQDAVDTLLWPWCHSNPDLIVEPRWDYFTVGGMYQAALDPEWTVENPERIWEMSQKQKKHLDLAALQARAVMKAAEAYDRIQAALAGRRLPDLAQLKRTYGEGEWIEHFHADPCVEVVRSVAGFLSPEGIVSYAEPRDVALAKERRRAILTAAIVQGDQWYNSDVWDWDEDPKRTEAWADLSEQLIADADPDAWLTIVDCHC